MIKKGLFLLFIFFKLTITAQEMTCDQKVEKLFIEKIKHFKSKDLVPYYSEKENKWGYMHRATKKIITQPIMKEPHFFQPAVHFYYSFETDGLEDGCSGTIMGSTENYRIESLNNAAYQNYDMASGVDYQDETKKNYKSMIKDAINGFEADKDGNLTFFNSKFYDAEKDQPCIQQLIFFKEKIYAITKITEDKKEYYSIINQEGIEFPGFKKLESYPNLKQIFSDDTDLWFLLKISDGNYAYKSLFENKQLADVINDTTIYGLDHTRRLGYAIYPVNKEYGVFDLTSMTWKIKPSAKNNFSYIHYASSELLFYENSNRSDVVISNEMIEKNRAKSYIYLQTSKDDFYDLNMTVYNPKKK